MALKKDCTFFLALIILLFGIYSSYRVGLFKNLKYIFATDSQIINCFNCNVIRIREASWVGFGEKPEPDKVWEIEAKPGVQTSNRDWAMEIVSTEGSQVTVQFEGKIYDPEEFLNEVTSPVMLNAGQDNQFGSGTVGGGANWTFTYLKKDLLYVWDSLIFQIIWFVLPIIVIVKVKGFKGFLLSALTFWLVGVLEGFLLSTLGQGRSSMIDGIWLILGFPGGLLYSSLIYVFYSITKLAIRNKTR